jgi:signal transduction histidine kinase
MSLSLIGIIFVQAYYINNILKTKEEQDIVIITLLSLVFTLIIIIGYMSAVYQLIRQRKISQMKSDFINNMTHEFKTPIATISLALDAIKKPKNLQ